MKMEEEVGERLGISSKNPGQSHYDLKDLVLNIVIDLTTQGDRRAKGDAQ